MLPALDNIKLLILSLITLSNTNQLGPYLAGLIEGDGSILIPGNPRSPSGSLNRGGFEICFHLKDYPLAENIRLKTGGFIRVRGQACILCIRNKKDVLNLINLINGHMRTPKFEALHRLINWYNNQYNTKIPLLNLDESPLQSNSWLSGMLDADGGFYLNWGINKNGLPITLQYYLRLSQRKLYHRDSLVGKSYFHIMNKISEFLSVPIRFINRKSKLGFEVRSGSYIANYIILSYLIKYPLFSYKYVNVPVQIDLLQLSLSKTYRTVEGLKFLTDLKIKMDFYSSSSHWDLINKNFWI